MKITNEDNMKLMSRYGDNHFDLCITSPPYNLGNKHHTGNKYFTPYKDDLNEVDYQKKQIEFLNELHRVCKDDSSVFYNHKNRIRNGLQISPYEWIFQTKWKVKQEIVWYNRSQNFDNIRFYPFTERIFWLSKSKETKFKNNIGLTDFNKWKPEGTNKKHKRAFPLSLCEAILLCYPKNLKVIEPYLGSGTMAIACHNLGFNLTACELDKEYYNAAMKRINNHTAQLRIC
jgi:DNA modification methylase